MGFSFSDATATATATTADATTDTAAAAIRTESARTARFLRTDGVPEWLDDIAGGRALDWARERSAETESLFDGDPSRDALEKDIRAALDTDARIP